MYYKVQIYILYYIVLYLLNLTENMVYFLKMLQRNQCTIKAFPLFTVYFIIL